MKNLLKNSFLLIVFALSSISDADNAVSSRRVKRMPNNALAIHSGGDREMGQKVVQVYLFTVSIIILVSNMVLCDQKKRFHHVSLMGIK